MLQIPGLGLGVVAIVRWLGFSHCHDATTLKSIMLQLGQGEEAWLRVLDQIAAAERPARVLIICGEAETPFFTIAKGVHTKLKDKAEFRSFPGASHMSWCHECDAEVGCFFRRHVACFVRGGEEEVAAVDEEKERGGSGGDGERLAGPGNRP